jgi:hypothetical protein
MIVSTSGGSPKHGIDATTFQRPLAELAETLALKVQREAVKTMKPQYVAIDIYVMIRQVLKTYELFFYLNNDERRNTDPFWHVGYSTAVLPLIRCMIDCLYNITALLEHPVENGQRFRASGYKRTLEGLSADSQRYGGDPVWDAYLDEQRKNTEWDMRINGFTLTEVMQANHWLTLSTYLRPKRNSPLSPHQTFLKTLTFGFWQEYSGMAHATFNGLRPTAIFYSKGDVPSEQRAQFEESAEAMISRHLLRVVGILICVLTEVQAYFRFDGARINDRLRDGWNAVLPAMEIKELYDLRYVQLMKDKGILP